MDNGIYSRFNYSFSGDPGIGKSTLLLQLAIQGSIRTLYVSEESESQIKLRADRIGVKNKECFMLNETLIENVLSYLSIKENQKSNKYKKKYFKNLYSNRFPASPIGSISQIRNVVLNYYNLQKGTNITIFIIGHITKDGQIAGPKILEPLWLMLYYILKVIKTFNFKF